MSTRIKTATMFTDAECLKQAIEDTGVKVILSTSKSITVDRTDFFGNQEFVLINGKFSYSHYSHDGWGQRYRNYKPTATWLSEVSERYKVRYQEKLDRIAEEERRREEERLRKLVQSRCDEIKAKAKEEGYYIKETEEEGTIRLVLVRTTY